MPVVKPPPVPRPGRKSNRRHSALKGRPRGVWYPDLVGVVPAYPSTQEAWQKKSDSLSAVIRQRNATPGLMTRKGIPDGWSGRREEVKAIKAQAVINAERIYATMIERGLIDAEAVAADPGTDAGRFEIAMKFSISVVLDVTVPIRERQTSTNLVMKYTKAPPAVTTNVNVARAEDFLTSLLANE